MEYFFLLLMVGVLAFVGIRATRKPVTVAPQMMAEPKVARGPIGAGSQVSVPFARRQVIGRVTRIGGRRVRIVALVKGHKQMVIRKIHCLQPA